MNKIILITNDLFYTIEWDIRRRYRSLLRKRKTIRNFGGQNFRMFVLGAFVLTGSMDAGCGFYTNSLIGHISNSIAIHLLVEQD